MALGKLWVIAYRDLGRNRRRSIFSLMAVALGLALLIMLNGLIAGVMDDALQNSIRLETGHVQLRAASYEEEKLSLQWQDLLDDPGELAAAGEPCPRCETAAPLLWAAASSTPRTNRWAAAATVSTRPRPTTTPIREGLVAGEFLTADDRSGILIGKRLADDLGLGVGDNVNLAIVNADGQAGRGHLHRSAASFRPGSLATTTVPSLCRWPRRRPSPAPVTAPAPSSCS